MATTVGQHSVASFTSPVNGTTPIDANTVRGNDNTIRVAYVDHDADPGIHVQSSSLASRPTAGTAGRKWITEDSGVYTLWFDDGTNWHPVSSENVALTVLAGENLVKGDVVKVTGWNNGQDLPEVSKVASASDVAFAVMTAAVSSGSMGYATNTGIVQDVNTNSFAVGTILYPNTSGGFTSTKPTSGNYQTVAFVLRQNTNNGVIFVEFSSPRIVERSDNTASTIVLRDSNGDFSAGTITATAVNATTLDLTNLEVTNIKAKDGTQAIAIADSTGATTFSANVTATLATAAQPNVTSVGTLTSLTVSGGATFASSTGNVGIGTTSPTDTDGFGKVLDVRSATGGQLLIRDSDDTARFARFAYDGTDNSGWVEATGTGSSLRFRTAGSQKMLLDASGNLAVDTNTLYVDATNNRVGVGTTSPSYRVHSLHAGGGADLFFADATGQSFGGYRIRAGAGNQEWAFRGGSSSMSLTDATASADRLTIDTSGNLAVDTDTLYVDAANNYVGIGTATPGFKLDVVGTGASSLARINNTTTGKALMSFANNGTNVGFLGLSGGWEGDSTSDMSLIAETGFGLRFYTNGSATERMVLDTSGNLNVDSGTFFVDAANNRVGVGTASPSVPLEVVFSNAETTATNSGACFAYAVNTDQTNNNYALTAYADAAGGASSGLFGLQFTNHASNYGDFVWWTRSAGGYTEKLRLDASGNLGLGVTPTEAFCVKRGASTAAYGEFAGNNNTPGSTSALYGQDAGGNAYAWNRANLPLLFGTNNTERARITSGGNLLVGTTAAAAGERLHVKSAGNTAATYNCFFANSDAALVFNFEDAGKFRTGTLADSPYNYTVGGTNRDLFVDNNGYIGYVSSVLASKTNIAPVTDVDWLLDLNPVTFNFRKKDEDGNYTDEADGPLKHGLIAEEVEAVNPDLCFYDDEANGGALRGVNYTHLITPMLKMIQKLEARIAVLEAGA